MARKTGLGLLITLVVACIHFENVAALLAYNPSNPPGVLWDYTLVAVVDQGDAASPTDLVIASKNRVEFVRLDENGTQIGGAQNFPFTVRSIAPSPNKIWILSNDGRTISYANVSGNNVGPTWFTWRVLPKTAHDIAAAWDGSAVYAVTDNTLYRDATGTTNFLEVSLDATGTVMANGQRAIAFDRQTNVLYAVFPVVADGFHQIRVNRWSPSLSEVISRNRFINNEPFRDVESNEDMVVIRSGWGTDTLRLYNNVLAGMVLEETISAPLPSFATVGTLSTTGRSSYAPLTGCDPNKLGGFLWRSRQDSSSDGRLIERRLLCQD